MVNRDKFLNAQASEVRVVPETVPAEEPVESEHEEEILVHENQCSDKKTTAKNRLVSAKQYNAVNEQSQTDMCLSPPCHFSTPMLEHNTNTASNNKQQLASSSDEPDKVVKNDFHEISNKVISPFSSPVFGKPSSPLLFEDSVDRSSKQATEGVRRMKALNKEKNETDITSDMRKNLCFQSDDGHFENVSIVMDDDKSSLLLGKASAVPETEELGGSRNLKLKPPSRPENKNHSSVASPSIISGKLVNDAIMIKPKPISMAESREKCLSQNHVEMQSSKLSNEEKATESNIETESQNEEKIFQVSV